MEFVRAVFHYRFLIWFRLGLGLGLHVLRCVDVTEGDVEEERVLGTVGDEIFCEGCVAVAEGPGGLLLGEKCGRSWDPKARKRYPFRRTRVSVRV